MGIKLTNDNFLEVLKETEMALVLISGEGCANCVSMYPMVKNMENTRDDVRVFYVEVDSDNYRINEHYGVEVVPTILLIGNGELVAKVKGYQPEEVFEIYVDAKIEEWKNKA